jgi:hypothetical protein
MERVCTIGYEIDEDQMEEFEKNLKLFIEEFVEIPCEIDFGSVDN